MDGAKGSGWESGMRYLLNENYCLRGWRKLPFALVDQGTGRAEFLHRPEMELDESELEAVAGAGSCGCAVAGGGKDKDLNCVCCLGGVGHDTETQRESCICVAAGGGKSGLKLR